MDHDEDRLEKIKKAAKEANDIGEDLLSLEHEEEIKRKAEVMEHKIGEVYEEIDKFEDIKKQSEAIKELESIIEKGSTVEKEIVKKKGFNPFKQK